MFSGVPLPLFSWPGSPAVHMSASTPKAEGSPPPQHSPSPTCTTKGLFGMVSPAKETLTTWGPGCTGLYTHRYTWFPLSSTSNSMVFFPWGSSTSTPMSPTPAPGDSEHATSLSHLLRRLAADGPKSRYKMQIKGDTEEPEGHTKTLATFSGREIRVMAELPFSPVFLLSKFSALKRKLTSQELCFNHSSFSPPDRTLH